jgi:hypothetical protein
MTITCLLILTSSSCQPLPRLLGKSRYTACRTTAYYHPFVLEMKSHTRHRTASMPYIAGNLVNRNSLSGYFLHTELRFRRTLTTLTSPPWYVLFSVSKTSCPCQCANSLSLRRLSSSPASPSQTDCRGLQVSRYSVQGFYVSGAHPSLNSLSAEKV